jgi:hypothetical protein
MDGEDWGQVNLSAHVHLQHRQRQGQVHASHQSGRDDELDVQRPGSSREQEPAGAQASAGRLPMATTALVSSPRSPLREPGNRLQLCRQRRGQVTFRP